MNINSGVGGGVSIFTENQANGRINHIITEIINKKL